MCEDQTLLFTETPTNAYPQILGSTTGNTQFNCIDLDTTNSRILIGGITYATDLGSSQTSTPVLLNLNQATGRVVWDSLILHDTVTPSEIFPQQIAWCKFQDGTGQYVVATSDTPQYGIFVFRRDTGVLEKALYEQDTSTLTIQRTRFSVGVKMTSGNRIYLASSENNRIRISAFDYSSGSSTFPAVYSKRYGNILRPYSGRFIHYLTASSYAYVTGQISSQIGMARIDLATGNPAFAYWVENYGGSSSQTMTAFATDESPNVTHYHIGCTENLGSTGKDIAMLYYHEGIDTLANLYKTLYITTTPERGTCMDVHIDPDWCYFLIHIENKGNYFGTFAGMLFSATSISVDQYRLSAVQTQTLYSTRGYIKPTYSFQIGATTLINSQSYSTRVGYIIMNPSTNSLTYTTVSTSLTVEVQTSFSMLGLFTYPKMYNPQGSLSILGTDATSESMSYKEATDIESSPITQLDAVELPTSMFSTPAPGTITPPTISTYQYAVNDPSFIVTFPDFTYSQTGSDIVWVYTSTLNSGAALPAFIAFTQEATGGKYVITTNDSSNIGSYVIKINAVLSGTLTSSTTFTLDILAAGAPTTNPTPTPTPSPTSTPSATSTPTPSPSSTSSPTSTPTVTSNSTPTPTTASTASANRDPYFTQSVKSNHQMYSGTTLTYALPTYTDPDGDQVAHPYSY